MSPATVQPMSDARQRVEDLIRLCTKGLEQVVPQRREAKRYALNAPVTLGVCLGDSVEFTPLYRAWGVDLSRHGVGLLLGQSIASQVKLHADFQALVGEPFTIPIRILYCRQLLSNTFQVGAVFLWIAH